MNATAPPALLWFVAGFGAWSLCFFLLYGLHAAGCAWGWQEISLGQMTLQRVVLGGTVIVHVGALVILSAVAWRWWRRNGENGAGRFVRASAVALTVAGLVATVWTGLPAVVLDACV